jgi:hypothetical protein
MSTVLIIFPPAAGGNHLKNIISKTAVDFYRNRDVVHQLPGSNLKCSQVESALTNPETTHILHGHFGEIMSYQTQIRCISDKKFIIICNDNSNDHNLLSQRRTRLGYFNFISGEYFESEQVFLYEPFMYHYYFDVPMENIMNIPISEWFVEDISSVIDKINYFLKTNLDVDAATTLHKLWYRNNFK